MFRIASGRGPQACPLIDHVIIGVTDTERSKAFYAKALDPLEISLLMELGTACGFGWNGKSELWMRLSHIVCGTASTTLTPHRILYRSIHAP